MAGSSGHFLFSGAALPIPIRSAASLDVRGLLCAQMNVHKIDVAVNPALNELAALLTEITLSVNKAFFHLNEGFRLAKRGNVKISQNCAKMLLRHRSADRAHRDANNTSGLSCPHALPVGARSMVDCVFEHAWN